MTKKHTNNAGDKETHKQCRWQRNTQTMQVTKKHTNIAGDKETHKQCRWQRNTQTMQVTKKHTNNAGDKDLLSLGSPPSARCSPPQEFPWPWHIVPSLHSPWSPHSAATALFACTQDQRSHNQWESESQNWKRHWAVWRPPEFREKMQTAVV